MPSGQYQVLRLATQRDAHPSLFQCWATVADGGPTLKQTWYNVASLKANHIFTNPLFISQLIDICFGI